MGGEEGANLESTPSWVVSIVCALIVLISLAVERLIHYIGKYLKKKDKKPLYQALQKIKEELMLMGFISLLLTVFQGNIGKLCISKELANKWLPCENKNVEFVHANFRRLLSEGNSSTYCHNKIKQWQRWEQSIQTRLRDLETDAKNKVTIVDLHDFLKNRSRAIHYSSLGWLVAFLKQFYGSVTKSDYTTMRKGFIMTHCKTNPGFDFYKYMVRAFESDFKKVVGISWFLWLFVVIFLFLNVNGYHTFFWIAFIPLVLLFGVGTKLEHIIIQLARQVAQRHIAFVGNDVEIQPSDDHFWFRKPRILLLFIHILFQNSFELAFFFWIWVQYGFDSCIMGSIGYTAPRLVIAVFVQFLCSYSTLPLYAIVTQMGSSFNKAIFEDHIQESLIDWAHTAKKTMSSVPAAKVLPKRTQSMPVMRLNNDHGSALGSVVPQGFPNRKFGLSLEKPLVDSQQHNHDSVDQEIEPAQVHPNMA